MIEREEKEDKYLDKIQKVFNDYGWDTYKKVNPEECKGWDKPFEVDLIVHHKDYGYIGIEGKHTRTLGQGSKVAQAITQINRYRKLTYLGNVIIRKWAIAVGTEKNSVCDDNRNEHIKIFLRGFLRHKDINISLLEFNEFRSWNKIVIDAMTPKAIKIPPYSNTRED